MIKFRLKLRGLPAYITTFMLTSLQFVQAQDITTQQSAVEQHRSNAEFERLLEVLAQISQFSIAPEKGTTSDKIEAIKPDAEKYWKGRVLLDESGLPLPGIVIKFECRNRAWCNDPGDPNITRSAITDEQGRFQVSLPIRRGTEVSVAPREDLQLLGFRMLDFSSVSDKTRSLDIRLKRGYQVLGRVIDDQTNLPVANASIEAFPSKWEKIGNWVQETASPQAWVKSDTNGYFSLILYSGSWFVGVHATDHSQYARVNYPFLIDGVERMSEFNAIQELAVVSNKSHEAIVLRLRLVSAAGSQDLTRDASRDSRIEICSSQPED